MLFLTPVAYIIKYASNLSALPAIWVGRREKHVLWYYALVSFAFDVNSFLLGVLGMKKMWSSNMFFFFEFLLVSAYFVRYVFAVRMRPAAIASLSTICAAFVVHTINHNHLQPGFFSWKPNYIGTAWLYGLYMFYSIYGLFRVMTEMEFVMIEKNPLFIFCIAFLLYSTGSFIILLFENELVKQEIGFVDNLWVFIRNPANIIKNLLIAYGLWLIKKHK